MSAEEHELTDSEYEDILDEIYGDVEICGMKYSSGRALKELDPIAFDCGKSDSMRWKCSECGKVYDDEQDAEDCCPVYVCAICGEKYFDQFDCNECENSHKEEEES